MHVRKCFVFLQDAHSAWAPQREPAAQVSGPYSVPESWAAFRAVDLLFVEPWISFFEPSSRRNSFIRASARPRLLGRIPPPKPGPFLERAERNAPRLSNELRPDFGAETCTKSWAAFRPRNLGRFKKLVLLPGYQVGPLSRRRGCDFQAGAGPFSGLRSLGPHASRSGSVPLDMCFAAGRHPQICQVEPLAFSRTTSHHSPSSARVDSTRCAKQGDHRSPSWARCHTSISGCFVVIVESAPHPRCRALLKAEMLGLPHLWKRAQTPACFSCGAEMHAWTSLSNVYHIARSRGRACRPGGRTVRHRIR